MNKKTTLILLAALILFLGGGALLYSILADKADNKQLQNLANLPKGETAAPGTAESENQATKASETASEEQKETRDPRVELAPDFEFYDQEGKVYKLSDFRGKPVVLNFWASWCPPCQAEMPDFDEKCREIGDTVQFLMINLTDNTRETVKVASAFIEEAGYRFPVFYDSAQQGMMTYQAFSIPQTFFIDAEGYLIASARGAIQKQILEKGIGMIWQP